MKCFKACVFNFIALLVMEFALNTRIDSIGDFLAIGVILFLCNTAWD